MEREPNPLGWGKIILTMIVVAVATGLLLGLVGRLFGLPSGVTGVGIGASVGVVGANLIARRRAAMAAAEQSLKANGAT
jgi:hypothetical protein